VLDVIIKTGYTQKANNDIPGLQKLSIDRNGELLFREVPATLEEQVRDGDGCRIEGKTNLLKVPSTLFISTEAYQF
jgi:hypothetical protein